MNRLEAQRIGKQAIMRSIGVSPNGLTGVARLLKNATMRMVVRVPANN